MNAVLSLPLLSCSRAATVSPLTHQDDVAGQREPTGAVEYAVRALGDDGAAACLREQPDKSKAAMAGQGAAFRAWITQEACAMEVG
jgi:hypothetical protein